MAKHYKREVGTVVTLDCGVDVSAGTTLEIEVEKPDGTLDTWTGAVDGTTGVKYTLTSSDFDQTGLYKMQAHVTAANGEWFGETVEIYVYDDFE